MFLGSKNLGVGVSMATFVCPKWPLRSWHVGRCFAPKTFLRLLITFLGLSVAYFLLLVYHRPGAATAYLEELESASARLADYLDSLWTTPSPHHIDVLIAEAAEKQMRRLSERSYNISDAAARYRVRRGRHPPPGFDKWVEFALSRDAIVVESFFDRIYQDLAPFWGLDPTWVATLATTWEHVVRVRDGNATGVGDTTGKVAWLELWTNLVAEAAPFLPDVDMPINYMDESRLFVPGEKIAEYMATEQSARAAGLSPKSKTITKHEGLKRIDQAELKPHEAVWHVGDRPIWDYVREACPADSEARNTPTITDFSSPPDLNGSLHPSIHQAGFIANFTAGSDPCTQPHLGGLHGSFVEPLSMRLATELIPLFGGSKLPMNNEILIPGAMYLTDDPFYSGGEATHGAPWKEKKDGLVWRGAASGGRNRAENWTRFQRHRLLEMLNGTTVARMAKTGVRAPTFDLSQMKLDISRTTSSLGAWLSSFADTGFVNMLCFPWTGGTCPYNEASFGPVPGMPMAEQYAYKFIPDADGNSFSARFRGLLRSTSVPLKATVYAEWHDDRLLPWLHFVPLDNTFRDLYAVLDFFTKDEHGDRAAEVIATQGKEWAEQVLRRDDMLVYVWRLLLEFARVCDPNRDVLGFAENGDVQ